MRSSLSRVLVPVLLVGMCVLVSVAQQIAPVTTAASVSVPRLVNYSGVLTDAEGRPLDGVTGVTFLLYKEQTGGAPLWMETQNVLPVKSGHYVATLGITKPEGLPADVFASAEARWLAVQVAGQAEQSRVLLVAVPYALKAADAETIGGLPPSAFVLAAPTSSASGGDSGTGVPSRPGVAPPGAAVTGSGTADFVPLWSSASTIGNSILFQSGSGTTAKIGINTAIPAATLDVKGSSTVRGTLSLPVTGSATATVGKNSQPLSLMASAFSSITSTAVNQTFHWQAEPAGNDTATPSGTLNLLFGEGATKPSETGLHIANNGQITFATGQTFPGTGTGDGSVTSVASGPGLTGGPITASGTLSIAAGGVSNTMLANPSLTVTAGTDLTGGGSVALGGKTTLNVDTTKVPQLNAPNVFTANQTVNANLYVNGLFGTGVTLTGSAPTFMGAGNNPNENGSGYPLTVSGGSAAVAASNAPGGDLILAAGNGNGLGSGGNVRLQAASPSFTGAQANSLVDRQFIAAAPMNMGGQNGQSSYFLLNLGNYTGGAIIVRFTIIALGGNDAEPGVASGTCYFVGVHSSRETTVTALFGADHVDVFNYVNPGCAFLFDDGQSGVEVYDSVTFDPSVLHTMYYQIENISGLPLTIQAQPSNLADRVIPPADRRANALHPRVSMTIHK